MSTDQRGTERQANTQTLLSTARQITDTSRKGFSTVRLPEEVCGKMPITWKRERAWLSPLLYLMHSDSQRGTTDLRQTTDTNKRAHLRKGGVRERGKTGGREGAEGREIRLSRSEKDNPMSEEWH